MTDPIPAFYERHPYPPPVTDIDDDLAAWADGSRRRYEHFRTWPTIGYCDPARVLVAGCGTSQAVRYAGRYPSSDVIGIDVSEHSLSSSRRLADHHGIANLELDRLAIEDVDHLGGEFDLIVCTGVLHHLADPSAGFRNLRSALSDRGACRLMVYGRHGRTGIEMIRRYAQLLGIEPTAAGVDDLIASLREIPLGHPIRHVLSESADVHDRDALADALLNPRERSYTVPEVLDEVEAAGLRFGRWVYQAPYRPRCGAITEVPHAHIAAGLPDAQQYAAMELYRGTISRHSLIAHRDDTWLPTLGSGADHWRDVVPIVAPAALLIDDRLPPGVAGVVVNRAHFDRDLVLFLDERQRAVFEMIDGVRPFGEVPGASSDFLELLWQHDLVVTDQSGSAS